MNKFANRFFPALAGGVVVPDRVGVANDPGIKVAHDWIGRRGEDDKDV